MVTLSTTENRGTERQEVATGLQWVLPRVRYPRIFPAERTDRAFARRTKASIKAGTNDAEAIIEKAELKNSWDVHKLAIAYVSRLPGTPPCYVDLRDPRVFPFLRPSCIGFAVVCGTPDPDSEPPEASLGR